MKRFSRWQLLGCCLATAVVTVCLTFSALGWFVDKAFGSTKGLERLFYGAYLLQEHFYDGTKSDKLVEGALKGMVEATGDPYTVYMDEQFFQQLMEHTEGTFGGIGIIFGKRDDKYVVIAALEENPGFKAGVKQGDIIVAVDGKPTSEMNMEQVSAAIRGQEGTQVELELANKEGATRKVVITRSQIKNPSVGGQLLPDSKIGYIRIAMFNENTGDDFRTEFTKLEDQGMESLILDLRGNPGGTLSDGVAVAGLLVPKGPIVSISDRYGNSYTESSSLEQVKYPLAVLVDGGTASAAEIVAGAVKDTNSGRLFGTKTFGKGSVQSVFKMSDNTGIKITVAKYYTPSGVCIHNIGIEPHETVELPENATEDTQLEAARKYLENL